MKYIWWVAIIIIYIFTLVAYAVISQKFFTEEDKTFSEVDTIFFGVASIITISIMPLIKETTS